MGAAWDRREMLFTQLLSTRPDQRWRCSSQKWLSVIATMGIKRNPCWYQQGPGFRNNGEYHLTPRLKPEAFWIAFWRQLPPSFVCGASYWLNKKEKGRRIEGLVTSDFKWVKDYNSNKTDESWKHYFNILPFTIGRLSSRNVILKYQNYLAV